MDQMSFGDGEYASKRKRTRREKFLGEMDQVIPWSILLNLIEPLYPKTGNGRRGQSGTSTNCRYEPTKLTCCSVRTAGQLSPQTGSSF